MLLENFHFENETKFEGTFSQIIVMLADDMPCNARNARPGW